MIRQIGLSLLVLAAPTSSVAQENPAGLNGHGPDSVYTSVEPTGSVRSGGYTIGAFPRALATNAGGLISSGNLAPLLMGMGLTLTARSLDDAARTAIGDRVEGFGDAGDFMGDRIVFTGAMAGLFAAGQIAPAGRFRRVTFDLAQGFVVNGVVTNVLKRAFRRQRPDSTNFLSFPSGHTSSFFTMATVLDRHLGPAVGVPATLAATFVALSRVEDREHFLSDVVAGGVIGFIVGRTVSARLGHQPGERDPRLSVAPFPMRRGGGVYVGLAF